MNLKLWQGVASLYAFFLMVGIFGLIGILEGDIVLGLLVIASSSGGAWIVHKIVRRYLEGRYY